MTQARQQSHRHEVMRPKAKDLQSQKVIVVCSVLIAQIGYQLYCNTAIFHC